MFVAALFVFGLLIGSFLEALTYRYPRGKSILTGRSYCPKCRTRIAFYDNIPLLSFLLLGGNCRGCSKKISLRCPLIELSTGSLFSLLGFASSSCQSSQVLFIKKEAVCFWQSLLGPSYLPFFLVLAASLVAIFVIDLEHQVIFDNFVFLMFGLIFLGLLFFSSQLIYLHLISAFAGALFLLLIHLLTLGKGMGLGDVKFALVGGLIFSWPLTLLWIFVSFVIGAVVGLFLIAFGKTKLGVHIPFGPFLVASLIGVMFLGANLLSFLFPTY